MANIETLGHGIYTIDLMEDNRPLRSSVYVIQDEKTVIVETGASPSGVHILSGLEQLGILRESIDAVIVTHIHMDHAGGAGKLLQKLPNAKLFVHKMGAKHMIDPTKLEAGTRVVYGERFDELFSPIVAVPESRVEIKDEGDRYDMGNGRQLHFYDSPGHALHHFFIYDTASEGIFTGDSGGIFYREIKEAHKVELCLPTTTPIHFDPEAMDNTFDKMLSLKPKRLFFTHFGMSDQAKSKLTECKNYMSLYTHDAVECYKKNRSWEDVTDMFRETIHKHLMGQGVPKSSPALESLELDFTLNALGIEAYVKRLERQKSKS